MITYKRVETAEDLQGAFRIRQLVFLVEQGIDEKEEFDVNDIFATHFIALKEGKIIGTVRVFPKGENAVIGRLAILKEERNQGVGTKLMDLAIEYAKNNTAKLAVASVQVRASDFYESLGFKKKGEEYMEVDIPHIKMVLELGETVN